MSDLKRSLGLWSAVSIVVGSIIGAGIFMRPASMAARLGSPYMLILVWIVAGAVSFIGAMIFAELGSLFPETGGPYIYLQKIYGDFIAFLYGWSASMVINTTALASIAFVAAQYLGFFIHLPRFAPAVETAVKLHLPFVADIYPLENFGVKSTAAAILGFLTLLNYYSTRQSNALQFLATALKMAALLLLVVGLLFTGKGETANFIINSPDFHPTGWLLPAAFMAATSGAFSSYDGWYNVNMVAGEIENPRRNLSRSLLIGLGACIAIYVLTTLAYIYIIPVNKMAGSPLVAADAMQKGWGTAAAGLVSALIIVSTFGATNSNFLANIRVLFAMGEGGQFFPGIGRVHPRFGTPGNAAILMGIISIAFVYSGSFDILADMFVFLSWIFYGLAGLGLFLLRKKMPALHRPFRVKGYPLLPLVFLAFTAFYLVTTLYNDISAYIDGKSPLIQSVFGLLLTAAGIPFYWYFTRRSPASRQKNNKPIR
jgi:APA family basic amino acid/polyamine antiporter